MKIYPVSPITTLDRASFLLQNTIANVFLSTVNKMLHAMFVNITVTTAETCYNCAHILCFLSQNIL